MKDIKKRLYVVILAGGRGERFWPQSRFDMPKQNLKLTGSKTMLQETFSRALSIVSSDKIYVVTGAECAGKTARDLPRVRKSRMLVEPCARNTAAAIGWASAVIAGRDPDAIIAVIPSDHLIGNIVSHLVNANKDIQIRQTKIFYKVDPEYGRRVAEGLGLNMKDIE